LKSRGLSARYIPEVGDIVDSIARESRDGDVILVMSNGSFGGIHQRLLEALGAAGGARAGRSSGGAPLSGGPRFSMALSVAVAFFPLQIQSSSLRFPSPILESVLNSPPKTGTRNSSACSG